MLRVIGIALVVLALIACGGDDDTGNAPAATTGGEASATGTTGTSAAATATEATSTTDSTGATDATGTSEATGASEPTSTPESETATEASDESPTATTGGDTNAPDGAPTPEDPNFPDVYADLQAGSSAEADTGEDLNGQPGRIKITIDAIQDPAEVGNEIYVLRPVNRLWVVEVTVESIGEGNLTVTEWSLGTGDGTEYEMVFGTGAGEELLFFELPPGESALTTAWRDFRESRRRGSVVLRQAAKRRRVPHDEKELRSDVAGPCAPKR
jgi:hypothetical protein